MGLDEETTFAEEASDSDVEIKSNDEIPTTVSPRSEIIDPTTMQSEIFGETTLSVKKQETTMSSVSSSDVETSSFAGSSQTTDSSITDIILNEESTSSDFQATTEKDMLNSIQPINKISTDLIEETSLPLKEEAISDISTSVPDILIDLSTIISPKIIEITSEPTLYPESDNVESTTSPRIQDTTSLNAATTPSEAHMEGKTENIMTEENTTDPKSTGSPRSFPVSEVSFDTKETTIAPKTIDISTNKPSETTLYEELIQETQKSIEAENDTTIKPVNDEGSNVELRSETTTEVIENEISTVEPEMNTENGSETKTIMEEISTERQPNEDELNEINTTEQSETTVASLTSEKIFPTETTSIESEVELKVAGNDVTTEGVSIKETVENDETTVSVEILTMVDSEQLPKISKDHTTTESIEVEDGDNTESPFESFGAITETPISTDAIEIIDENDEPSGKINEKSTSLDMEEVYTDAPEYDTTEEIMVPKSIQIIDETDEPSVINDEVSTSINEEEFSTDSQEFDATENPIILKNVETNTEVDDFSAIIDETTTIIVEKDDLSTSNEKEDSTDISELEISTETEATTVKELFTDDESDDLETLNLITEETGTDGDENFEETTTMFFAPDSSPDGIVVEEESDKQPRIDTSLEDAAQDTTPSPKDHVNDIIEKETEETTLNPVNEADATDMVQETTQTSFNADDITTAKSKNEEETTTVKLGKSNEQSTEKEVDEEITTASLNQPISEEQTTTVTILEIEENYEETVITTTAQPILKKDISTELPITLNEVDIDETPSRDEADESGVHEFDCKETESSRVNAAESQLPLECVLRNGEEPRTVYIVINREGVDTNRLFDKNVKVVVNDLMIMDISPK